MADCTNCGAPLPSVTFGALSDLCRACRKLAAREREDTKPRRAWPPVTTALVGINVAVFVAMVVGGVSVVDPTVEDLLTWGADFGPRALGGEPWRMLTSMFVHVGILHLAMNMWCLLSLGEMAEALFHRAAYLSVYLLSGLGGSVLALLLTPLSVAAGASGAVFGVAGALIAKLWSDRRAGRENPLRGHLTSLLAFAAYNIVIGTLAPGISNAAHVGGLVTGFLTGLALSRGPEHGGDDTLPRRHGAALAAAAILLLAATLAVRSVNAWAPHIEAGERAFEAHRYDQAVQEWTIVAEHRPDLTPPHVYLAASYLELKNDALAETHARRAIALEPRNVPALDALGVVLLRTGRTDEGIRVLTDVVKSAPDWESERLRLANALIDASRAGEAVTLLEAGVRRKPGSAQLQYALGYAQAVAGHLAEAKASFEEAARLGSPEAKKALEAFRRAE